MYSLSNLVYLLLYNLTYTFTSPFFYIILLVVYHQYKKMGDKIKPFKELLISTFFGVFGGMIGSFILIFLNISLNIRDFIFILPIAVLLSLISPRYICYSYSAGFASLISLSLGIIHIDIYSIMVLISILHLVECILVLLDGQRNSILELVVKKGKVMEGYSMNNVWPLPIYIYNSSLSLFPVLFIAILSYGDFTKNLNTKRKTRKAAGLLFLYSIILFTLASLPINKYIVSVYVILGHDLIIFLGNREKKNNYKFMDYGLKVIEVSPNSIGEDIGLKPGHIMLELNGKKLYNSRVFERILFYNPKKYLFKTFSTDSGLRIKEYSGSKKLGIKLR